MGKRRAYPWSRFILALLAATTLLVSMSACGTSPAAAPKAAAPAPAAPAPAAPATAPVAAAPATAAPAVKAEAPAAKAGDRVIPQTIMSAGSIGGTWYPVAAAIAEKANANFKGYPITAIPGPGGVGNPSRVEQKEADFGMSYGPFLKAAELGEAPYDKKHTSLRAVASMLPNIEHIVVAKELPVNTIDDIGKQKLPFKVATGTPGSTEIFSLELYFKLAGFSINDVKSWGGRVDMGGTSNRIDLWKDRHVDGANHMIALRSAAVTEQFTSRPAKLLGFSDAMLKKLVDEWGFVEYTIPAGVYKGQDTATNTVALPYVLFAHTGISDEIVYFITKAIAENKQYLTTVSQPFSEWKPEDMVKGLGVAMHPGARKYYLERKWITP